MTEQDLAKFKVGQSYRIYGITLIFKGYDSESLYFTRKVRDGEKGLVIVPRKKLKI